MRIVFPGLFGSRRVLKKLAELTEGGGSQMLGTLMAGLVLLVSCTLRAHPERLPALLSMALGGLKNVGFAR